MAFQAVKPRVTATADESDGSSDENALDFGSEAEDNTSENSSNESSDEPEIKKSKKDSDARKIIKNTNSPKNKSEELNFKPNNSSLLKKKEVKKGKKQIFISAPSVNSEEDSKSEESDIDNIGSGIDNDASDDDDKINKSERETDTLIVNEGWADSVAKILGSNKPKNKKTLVLSRAKKHADILKKEKEEKLVYEVVGDDGVVTEEIKEKPKDVKIEKEEVKKKKKIELPSARVKPDIVQDRELERMMRRIATKGVVQLFNAVRNHQKSLETTIKNPSLTEAKKEKILKKFDKRTFLDSLMGGRNSKFESKDSKVKDEVKQEETPKWNALRDDFMMGAKLKDWDKEPDET